MMTLIFSISHPIRFSLKMFPDLKFGVITFLRYTFLFIMSFMSLCFQMFSMVFPNTELFMSLKKSFSKSFASPGSKLGIELNVWHQPMCFVKLDCMINSFQDQPMLEGLIEIHGMDCLTSTCCSDLEPAFELHEYSFFTHKQKIIMEVMKVARIRHVNLQEVTLTPFLGQLTEFIP